ncbi:xanthine dehydrogenase small subunit [Acinetobacter baylyi]|uniref:Xanthine dehydrogenase, small subunit n=1 Tax=Acinetobacter baylyi (strain ATCC 33305 / BD413 / ADP1) TaxID=62977 RepID=Q6F9M6_ACIAD|nr:xanthine dehydrogenase small subunit [Acinetobacter baylyi]ENV54175.1 xanthine dehydrogenase, small subunit [Acinetobacter baylyi DSM 14961 = CIP 107474]KAF2371830.1 xanthine dehydrogenase small subunit [Acinetobacter baylyi]KAF2375316.1 xanthine dehydrogenase small subunit [Acinetobacter baylyi]KAF2376814.1 xanthine dehydrogenase small subunit [Acinetobacter baylyi]KAF2382744.1 xanthine dehydrogenase small subunit [Acinetobacter baylyi]
MSQRPVTFFFRGKTQQVAGVAPVMTVLQFLREHGGLDQVRQTGTKEGCAEGDCGACTVVIGELVNDQLQLRSVNACIQFLPTLDGKALFTVEDLKTLTLSSESVLHPVQQAMVEHHGSQCGFCTPGFIMSLWSMYENESHAPDKAKVSDYLSGNLCRCTGYRPILDAAQKAFDYPKVMLERQNIIEALKQIQALPSLQLEYQGQQFFAPKTVQEFAALRQQYPQARIVAGSTDVGLWVTKLGRDLGDMLYIGQVQELKSIDIDQNMLHIGANVSLSDALSKISDIYPDFEELQRRFASMPIKNAGTLGGNIANGSPIGDSMPALITLDTILRLRSGEQRRDIALADYYLDYQKTALQAGEFVEAILIPIHSSKTFKFATYKISKRFEQDISAVCAAFSCELDENKVVQSINIAFGGMAAIPKRAVQAEAVLLGKVMSAELIQHAQVALAQDFQPLSDGRASSAYRLQVAQNCLQRFYLEKIEDTPMTRVDDLIALVEV